MFRKIRAKELKVGDVYTRIGTPMYPHVVTHVDEIKGNDILVRVRYDWAKYSDCFELIAKEQHVYRFII